MATDGFQYRPWGPWPTSNLQGPIYGQPYSNFSPQPYTTPSIMDKPPLTHLQELTRVFPSPSRNEGSSDNDSGWGDSIGSADTATRESYSYQQNSPDCPDQTSQPEYSHSQSSYASVDDPRTNSSTNQHTPDSYYSVRECDSGFVPEPVKEDTDVEATEERSLPGFHQAFGSTEIGRFSRTDFFRQPSPQPITTNESYERPRKVGRKPKVARTKAASPRKELKDEREEKCGTYDSVVPAYQTQYPMAMCPTPYGTYHDSYPNYAYERSFPRCPNYEYLRSFPSFPIEHHTTSHQSQPWQSHYGLHSIGNPWSPGPPVHSLFRYNY